MPKKSPILRRYDSLEHALEAATTERVWKSQWSQNIETGKSAWSGTTTWREAETLMREGWSEGAAMMDKGITASLDRSMPAKFPGMHLDTAGAYPIPAIAAAGIPDCMVMDAPVADKVKPVVTLVTQQFLSSGYKANQINNYGIAICANIDRLEAAGVAIEHYHSLIVKVSGQYLQIDVRMKLPSEPLELDRLAFFLAHPASFRRFSFALFECEPRAEKAFRRNYGMATNPDRDLLPLGSVYIPGLNVLPFASSHLETPEAAAKAMTGIIDDAIKDVYGPIADVHYQETPGDRDHA